MTLCHAYPGGVALPLGPYAPSLLWVPPWTEVLFHSEMPLTGEAIISEGLLSKNSSKSASFLFQLWIVFRVTSR